MKGQAEWFKSIPGALFTIYPGTLIHAKRDFRVTLASITRLFFEPCVQD